MQTLKSKIQANAYNTKQTAINLVLITNAFVWYYFVIELLKAVVNPIGKASPFDQTTVSLIWVLHFAGIIFSALIGALIVKKITNRKKFILLWMLLGAILSLFSIVLDLTYIPNILLLSSLFGISLGIGMPSCMGYFSGTIAIEKRGFIAGIIFLLSGVIMTALGTVSEGNIGLQTIILSGWRWFGVLAFAIFLVSSSAKDQLVQEKPAHYKSILTQKSFLFYLIPWTLFSLIAYLSLPVQNTVIDYMKNDLLINMPTVEFLRGIENILVAISAVVCGFLADRIGRKRIAIVGFAMLGLGYSFVGIQPYNPLAWYAYTFFDGFALGLLYVIFVVTIWSDLSGGSRSEKYYAIGVMPFFISYLLRLTASSEISSTIDAYSIFSFIAIFLFMAVLPLVYAPETLPDKVMKDRDLKSYVDNAKKKAQKEAEKKHKKKTQDTQTTTEPTNDKNDEEYEKAKALAEKYY